MFLLKDIQRGRVSSFFFFVTKIPICNQLNHSRYFSFVFPGIEQCANREERQLVLIINSQYMKDDIDKYTQVK